MKRGKLNELRLKLIAIGSDVEDITIKEELTIALKGKQPTKEQKVRHHIDFLTRVLGQFIQFQDGKANHPDKDICNKEKALQTLNVIEKYASENGFF